MRHALTPRVADSNEPYLSDCQFAEPAAWAKDAENAEKLWKLSEELIGEKFD